MGTSDKPSPVFYSVFANVDGRTVALPQYSGRTENIVLDKVLEAAEREGYKGTAADRIKELGWWVGPVYADPPAGMPRPPWMKPDQSFGGDRPEHAMDVMSDDFHGIAAAIHHAMEALSQHEDAGTDWSPLDPKCSRRLRQALMAAWVLEYPKEAEALCVKLPYPPPTTA